MTTGHVYITTSLDGFIAREDHGIDWLKKYRHSGEALGFERFMASVDGVVMGRESFLKLLEQGDWPYAKPVIVLSSSLTVQDVPEALRPLVELSSSEPSALMNSLNQRGWRRVRIQGSKLVQSWVRLGLIDDLIITTVPILIGRGVRLFGDIESDIELEVVEATRFESGLMQTHYRVGAQAVELRPPTRHRSFRSQWSTFRRGA